MAMRIIYPNLHAIWPHLANPNEAAYVAASLTFLPHGLIGVMLAAMFSATMASLSAMFNLKSAILSKDIYQTIFRPSASERELLVIGAIMTLLIGGVSTVLAVIMASRGDSIFSVMMTFNTLISLSYGPPALLGLVFRRTPRWSGMLTFATGLVLGMLGDFVFHWTFIEQILFVVPPAFAACFFLSMLFDFWQESPERARLFKKLNTPIDPSELSDVPDFSRSVFRFLSYSVGSIGLASLLLLIPNPQGAHMTIFCYSALLPWLLPRPFGLCQGVIAPLVTLSSRWLSPVHDLFSFRFFRMAASIFAPSVLSNARGHRCFCVLASRISADKERPIDVDRRTRCVLRAGHSPNALCRGWAPLRRRSRECAFVAFNEPRQLRPKVAG